MTTAAQNLPATTPDPPDTRPDQAFLAGDRENLEWWVELYRQTLPLKVGGLTGEQLAQRAVPPSTLSLAGIVRHLTEVELYWCGEVVAGAEVPDVYSTPASPEGDFLDAEAATAVQDVAAFSDAVERARAWCAGVTDLDAPVAGTRHGNPVNLRWVYAHLIEEYARHLGHADLLREVVDGRTGY